MIELDLSYLESITDGDKEFMKELVEIFKGQVVEYIEEFAAAMEAKDVTTLGRIAHKAKSSVVVMGLVGLAEELNTFEIEAADGKFLDHYPKYIEHFEEQSKSAIIQLDEL